MSTITTAIRKFLRDEEGQDIIEYGLLAAFIAIVVAATVIGFKDPLVNIYQRILTALQSASGAS